MSLQQLLKVYTMRTSSQACRHRQSNQLGSEPGIQNAVMMMITISYGMCACNLTLVHSLAAGRKKSHPCAPECGVPLFAHLCLLNYGAAVTPGNISSSRLPALSTVAVVGPRAFPSYTRTSAAPSSALQPRKSDTPMHSAKQHNAPHTSAVPHVDTWLAGAADAA